MGAFPTPLVTGTIVFAIIAFAFSCCGLWLKRTKKLSRDNSQLFCLSVGLATICAWLMWVCTWLHQWHSLISPTSPIHTTSDPEHAGHL